MLGDAVAWRALGAALRGGLRSVQGPYARYKAPTLGTGPLRSVQGPYAQYKTSARGGASWSTSASDMVGDYGGCDGLAADGASWPGRWAAPRWCLLRTPGWG